MRNKQQVHVAQIDRIGGGLLDDLPSFLLFSFYSLHGSPLLLQAEPQISIARTAGEQLFHGSPIYLQLRRPPESNVCARSAGSSFSTRFMHWSGDSHAHQSVEQFPVRNNPASSPKLQKQLLARRDVVSLLGPPPPSVRNDMDTNVVVLLGPFQWPPSANSVAKVELHLVLRV